MSAPPRKPGMSLYADLLGGSKDASSGGATTISSAPVKYHTGTSTVEAEDESVKKKDASLKFQPIKRPQAQQKAKKPSAPSSSSLHKFSSSNVSTAPPASSSPDKQIQPSTTQSQQQQQQSLLQRSNLEDWVGDPDEDELYLERMKRERGGKRGRQNKRKKDKQIRTWDWDDIYDPTLPNSYADYKGSEEQYREIRDWKARLYYHQFNESRRPGKAGSSESEGSRPANPTFAPPSGLSFAPPSFDDGPESAARQNENDEYYSLLLPAQQSPRPGFYSAPSPAPPPSVPDDVTGDDGYGRRMHFSGVALNETNRPEPTVASATLPFPSTSSRSAIPPVSIPPSLDHINKAANDIAAKRAEVQAKLAAAKAKMEAARPTSVEAPSPSQQPRRGSPTPAVHHASFPPPPPPPSQPMEPVVTVSRAPVRYNLPAPPADEDLMEDDVEDEPLVSTGDEPKSNRPGQKGFAERLLKKWGWEKGQGLGAEGNEGITTAIVAKAEKRKKRSDANGGGWAAPKNMGKIVGGKRRKLANGQEDDRQSEEFSEVVKLEGMLANMDVDHEIQENNLMQEIGDEFGNKYGKVERLFVWRRGSDAKNAAGVEVQGSDEVFVKFTSQLSALRAIQACDGMTFAGNDVKARFWPTEMFETGVYG